MARDPDGLPALIVAHPGHELLLHHWIERERPVVFALTDGSGPGRGDRSGDSARVIASAGGVVGPVFGVAPDRKWYAAILSGDLSAFRDVASRIRAACIQHRVTTIVTDAVEFFNPMHDLCHALARGIARAIHVSTGRSTELLDYAIERNDLKVQSPVRTLALDTDALARKRAAAASVPALAPELRRHADERALACERLHRVDPAGEWPLHLTEEPFYQRVGRQRVAAGTYDVPITYLEHVRPLALDLSTP
jgi:hypothetical protein